MLNQLNIQDIICIARQAGEAIMDIYRKDFHVEYKDDQSPVTEADHKANSIIMNGLDNLSIKLPVLSEEGKEIPYDERKNWDYFWMVDPLDGTKEFIKKNDEFTVNIALIHKEEPILGVVFAPALDEMYWAAKGSGAYKNGQKLPLHTNPDLSKILRVVASKSHLSAEAKSYINEVAKTTQKIECISRGSSLKLCMVAEGSADLYPRLGPTMEWDTAAADAIVREAGASTQKYKTTKQLRYNKKKIINPWFICSFQK